MNQTYLSFAILLCLTYLSHLSQAGDVEGCKTILADNNAFYICPDDPSVLTGLQGTAESKLVLSFTGNHATNCNGTKNSVWGTYTDIKGECYDVASQEPTYTLQDEQDPIKGFRMTFPIQESESGPVQFIINLSGLTNEFNYVYLYLTQLGFSVDRSDELLTITVTGTCIYGPPSSVETFDI